MGRDGWLRRLGPWVGIGTSPAAMMTGGGVGEGLRGAELMAALVTGVALLGALAAGQGILGQRTGRTLASLTAGPLGADGSRRTASVVMLAMMVGWFGVNVGVAGVALGRLLGMPDVAGVILFAAVMLAVVGFGLGVLSWSALVAGMATTALAIDGLRIAFEDRDATLSGGLAGDHPIGFLSAVTLVIGYGAAFSLRTPDFTHDLARTRQVVWCALVGLAIPTLAFGFAGAALYAVDRHLGPGRRAARPGQPDHRLPVRGDRLHRVRADQHLVGRALAGRRGAAGGAPGRPGRGRRGGHRPGRRAVRRPDAVVAHDHGPGGAGAGRHLRDPRRPGRRRRDPDGGRSAWAHGGRASRAASPCTWQALLSRSRRRRSCRRWPTGCSARGGSGNWRTHGLRGRAVAIETSAARGGKVGLDAHGIDPQGAVWWNLPVAALYERALASGDAELAEGGPLVVSTGAHTGRAPKDKYVVREPGSEDRVWWGAVNQPIDAAVRASLGERLRAHLGAGDVYVIDAWAGRRPHPPPAAARRDRERLARPLRAHPLHRADRRGARRPRARGRGPARPRLHRGPRRRRHPRRQLRDPAPDRPGDPDRRHPVRRRDQEVDLHPHERPPAPARRALDALLGQRRRRRPRRRLLRPLRHRQDHPLHRLPAAPDRRRRARLGRGRRLQHRGRLLRQGHPPLARGRARDLRHHPELRHGARERGHGPGHPAPGPRRRLGDREHPRRLSARRRSRTTCRTSAPATPRRS